MKQISILLDIIGYRLKLCRWKYTDSDNNDIIFALALGTRFMFRNLIHLEYNIDTVECSTTKAEW